MSDLDKAADAIRIALTALDLLEHAVKTATTSIAAGRKQLSHALAEYEAMRDKLEAGDAKADTALDEKFR